MLRKEDAEREMERRGEIVAAAQLPLRRETGAGCLRRSDHLREGGGIVAPIVLPLV